MHPSSATTAAATRSSSSNDRRRAKVSASHLLRLRCLHVLLALALLVATIRQCGYLVATNAVLPTSSKKRTSADDADTTLLDFVLTIESNLKTTPDAYDDAASTTSIIRGASGRSSKTSSSTGPNYHVIFSTSCDDQQHWESYLLFYSAMKVGQPGNVTRIVSGCKPNEAQQLRRFHARAVRTMSDRFHLHFTPDFSRVRLESGKHPFKYGVLNWMEQGLGITPKTATEPANIPSQYRDDIIMLLDPDMVLLRPLRHNFTDEEVLWVADPPATTAIRHGFPMSQQDGYLGLDWRDLNWTYITNQPRGQYVMPPTDVKEGRQRWIAGPPYMATVKDMYDIAVLWADYSPRVLDLYPGTFAEMFGFIIASRQLNLPHTFIKSIVVSETDSDTREGWKYVDEIPNDRVCDFNDVPMPPSARMPIGLHYCQTYLIGQYYFSKYRVKKSILNCNQGLYLLPPEDILKRYNYSVAPKRMYGQNKDTWKEKRVPLSPLKAKREAFMVCRLMQYLNEALVYLKDRTCPNKGNQIQNLSVYLDYTV